MTDRLPDSPAVTASLVHSVIDTICRRHSHPGRTSAVARMERLIAEEAWIEVALALIDLELPQWQLRRLAYDAGEWYCALSRRRELPDWLDQAVEGSHPDLPRALLQAFLEAQRIAASPRWPSVPATPRESAPHINLCCDNFA
ncbi:hypothetical protein [Bradyrhizobium sp. Tv2a-2]|uniref:hypothetical protein n=1 Tax=Bradyrhizobium sp. Tv2a-2 TaxID=113395 RepID=UPI000687B681|nr:hypothetical protein [Bradyrhizobium sp. Tv2a-2]